MTKLTVAAALPLVLLLGACHHDQATVVTPTQGTLNPASAPATAAPVAARACGGDSECGDKQLCIRGQCVDITTSLHECQMERVHFDFNAAQVHQDDRPMLDRIARCLKADQQLKVRIEGNADERGTEEYNLALGDRRATTVAKYLESVGVSAAQLGTVSYGKDHPLCVEHDEACWAKNRRAAVKPSARR
jgi:peptidoglycan-associated lipoprotein